MRPLSEAAAEDLAERLATKRESDDYHDSRIPCTCEDCAYLLAVALTP